MASPLSTGNSAPVAGVNEIGVADAEPAIYPQAHSRSVAALRTLLLTLNVTCLDAPLVAITWQLFLARVLEITLSPNLILLLGLSVWCAYAGDRWLDGVRMATAQAAPPASVRAPLSWTSCGGLDHWGGARPELGLDESESEYPSLVVVPGRSGLPLFTRDLFGASGFSCDTA